MGKGYCEEDEYDWRGEDEQHDDTVNVCMELTEI
jgi:hypothetical protein